LPLNLLPIPANLGHSIGDEMLDNDDPDAPNGGKPVLLRMSKNDRERLDQICERTGLNPSDALRAAIGFAHGGLFAALKTKETEFQTFKWESYHGDS
jgi:hypothetical protein